MHFRSGPMPAPVKVGEEFDVTIEAVGEKGDGVAKKDGFVLFVPDVQQGDRVRIRVTKVLRKVGFAERIGEATTAAIEADQGVEMPDMDVSESLSAPSEPEVDESNSFGDEPTQPSEPET